MITTVAIARVELKNSASIGGLSDPGKLDTSLEIECKPDCFPRHLPKMVRVSIGNAAVTVNATRLLLAIASISDIALPISTPSAFKSDRANTAS